jgi:nitrile hydratase
MMAVVDLDLVRSLYKTPGAAQLKLDVAPRFKLGDVVVALNINPSGHTRLPRYIRGKKGVVERDHGVFHLPDSRAAGKGDAAQHMYTVCFGAREVWGDEAPAKDSLRINLWDDYMTLA